jgi:1-deoxy-D-xylulose-5-phosphate reductoisomerase
LGGGAGDGRERVRVAVLGSTGSIGRQALDVLARLENRFDVRYLAGGSNRALLGEQARQFKPAMVSMDDPVAAHALEPEMPSGTAVSYGPSALEWFVKQSDVDLVLVGTSGVVSLRPVLAALRTGKIIATANKEVLVMAGHLVMPEARARSAEVAAVTPEHPLARPLGWLRPIDSEHSAIWQCLAGERTLDIGRLVLTASGGPFLDADPSTLDAVTPEQALRHPTWRMGAKITIDSATLANKGLEVIEARWLYDVPYEAIDVVIHPQSVVHSAVQFVDGSLKAQLGTPDMRLPIQYALTYPARAESPVAAPDLIAAARLDFRAPDEGRFPALRIAREAGRIGSRATAALISADEVAVGRFLDGSLSFTGIPRLLEAAVTRFGEGRDQEPDVDTLVALEAEVRAAFAHGAIGSPV